MTAIIKHFLNTFFFAGIDLNVSTSLAKRFFMLVWRKKKRLLKFIVFGILFHITVVIFFWLSTTSSLEPVERADVKR